MKAEVKAEVSIKPRGPHLASGKNMFCAKQNPLVLQTCRRAKKIIGGIVETDHDEPMEKSANPIRAA